MRLPIVLFVVALAVPALAKGWTAPGWYVVGELFEMPFIFEGPFDGERACLGKLPSEDLGSFVCQELGDKPQWDR